MRTNRRGTMLAFLGVLLLPLIVFASVSLDLCRVYLLRAEMQRAADAGALAGASGLIDGDEGGELVIPRIYQFVNHNPVGGRHADVDSIVIDHDAGRMHVVLGYDTDALMLAGPGIRLHARAGAQVNEEAVIGEDGAPSVVKRLGLSK
jgi:Putative Flp pilus-assembly TadE/G-like